MFRLAAQRVESGELSGKAETSVWIARRMNVVVGPEWDNALQICADYFDSVAGDDPESIAKTLNTLADTVSPKQAGITHIVRDERKTEEVAAISPDIAPGESDPGVEPDKSVTEQAAAEPPTGTGGVTKGCPGGNCPRQSYWFWW